MTIIQYILPFSADSNQCISIHGAHQLFQIRFKHFFSLGKNDSALEIHDLDLTLEIQRYFYDLQIMKRFFNDLHFQWFLNIQKTCFICIDLALNPNNLLQKKKNKLKRVYSRNHWIFAFDIHFLYFILSFFFFFSIFLLFPVFPVFFTIFRIFSHFLWLFFFCSTNWKNEK